MTIIDGNEAVAAVAYALSEVIAIYPITPSSSMAELADQWAAARRPNLWGTVPTVVEMQSEAGAAGALHGAVTTGAMCTTFTASQGLLLMIPNMYKIAGELTPTVFHVSARSVATQALSIFGDHSDVMAVRSTGFALLASNNPQEASDMAAVAHAATLRSRIPFLHFFDGFRTSHELSPVEPLLANDLRALVDADEIIAHRRRGLSPDRPSIRGTAHNPDTFFQSREASNGQYLALPSMVSDTMEQLEARTGRPYHLFDYVGAPDAERVIVIMGSGADTVEEVVRALPEPIGVLKVRLYRPFSADHFLQALPATVKSLAVLDRTKEAGGLGEPLYQDVLTVLRENDRPMRVIGGRYGLSSKEFTPGMARAVFDELRHATPRNHFTIGIHDDVTHTSLSFDTGFSTEPSDTVRAVFYGLGSDGTVGANKNSIKIIGEETPLFAQGYFVYDSKKSGSVTISHLRFGPHPIHSAYLITQASFVACHQFSFLARTDVLALAAPGATFLLNCPHGPETVWQHLPLEVQQTIVSRKLHLHVINALEVARECGMGGRINTVMQTCFFALSGVLPRDEAVAAIKRTIEKTYGKRGEAVVRKNFEAVDASLAHLFEVTVPATMNGTPRPGLIPGDAPPFVREVTQRLLAGEGDLLPVSSLPVDGTWPCGTSRFEKRNISTDIPIWDEKLCIQCGKCVVVCPHAVLRAKVYEAGHLTGAPVGFRSVPARWKERPDELYTLQVAPEDCTGCTLCVDACPVRDKSQSGRKAIDMEPQLQHVEEERRSWDFFLGLPDPDHGSVHPAVVKDVQLLQPLFEFSGACAGCGETPYLRLLSQLFGNRALIANATGCSSIYGGNLPTTPWSTNRDGQGPAWSNSLFEDNAEFGLGFRLSVDQQCEVAVGLLNVLRADIGDSLTAELIAGVAARDEAGIQAQRSRVRQLRQTLGDSPRPEARALLAVADRLVYTTVWIVGGDGWAYDIGYGGLDHVLASGRDVNVLVLDTEVYSNTGGQASKSTPRAATAKFAAGGKTQRKKDMALLAMSYGNVYVARIALGANDTQTVRALLEAEAYPGPSLVLAYSHCIAHGYDMADGLKQQKAAVASGYWPLLRYHPDEDTLELDCKAPSVPLSTFTSKETRYTLLEHADPETARQLMAAAQSDVKQRWARYEQLAQRSGETR